MTEYWYAKLIEDETTHLVIWIEDNRWWCEGDNINGHSRPELFSSNQAHGPEDFPAWTRFWEFGPNFQMVPPKSYCANCDQPILWVLDYLCEECR